MSKEDKCACSCCLEPASQQVLNQSMVRYNDRSAFANNLQQDSVVQLMNTFQSQAQNDLQKTPQSDMMNQQSLTAALSTLIAAAKA